MPAHDHEKRPDRQQAKAPAQAPERVSPESALAMQRMIGNHAVSRLIADDEAVQRDAMSLVDKATRRPGSPLPMPLRQEMEDDFGGADFSDVRSRVDRESAEAVGAKAYTTKTNQIVFRSPADMDKHTVRHELEHVEQQRKGLAAPGVSHPGDFLEHAAEDKATSIEQGKRSVPGSHGHGEAGR